jgi:hypothetical protein
VWAAGARRYPPDFALAAAGRIAVQFSAAVGLLDRGDFPCDLPRSGGAFLSLTSLGTPGGGHATTGLFAFGGKIVVEGDDLSLGIHRDVEGIMYQKIVSRPLSYDSKVIYGSILEAGLGRKFVHGYACTLIFIAGCLTRSSYTLRIILILDVEAAGGVPRDMEQVVQLARQLDYFALPVSGARDEDE